jgi:hypothetical protein
MEEMEEDGNKKDGGELCFGLPIVPGMRGE